MNTKEIIDGMMREHDDDPAGVFDELRRLASTPLSAEDLPRVSWLINHVIGEKGGNWADAHALQSAIGGEHKNGVNIRNRAIAASLCGAVLDQWRAEALLAEAASCPPARIAMSIRLGALQYLAAAAPMDDLVCALDACTREVALWPDVRPLGEQIAAAFNNTVSALLDRTDLMLEMAERARVVMEAAVVCRTIWTQVGTWVNHERADYLVALCANASQRWDDAVCAARSGLSLIQSNGKQDVDRAFLLLELGRALTGAGDADAGMTARNEAVDMATAWSDPGLREWFESRSGAPLRRLS